MTTLKEIAAGHKLPVSQGGSLPDEPATEPETTEPTEEKTEPAKEETEPENTEPVDK